MGSKIRQAHSHTGSGAISAVTNIHTHSDQNHLLGPAQTKNISYGEPDRWKWTWAHTVTSFTAHK